VIVDSHVHLNHPDFKDDLADVIARARDAGVSRMVNIGFDLESSKATLSLVESHAFLYGAVGVHPHDAKTFDDAVEKELGILLDRDRIVAVGEIGLDYYRDLTPRDAQRDAFHRQLALAERKKKPVIIHCRDAYEDVLSILEETKPSRCGIFHAFGAEYSVARRILDLGFRIGIGGVVTFRNSNLASVAAKLPVESIVLETDCPYLTPVPFRGKRNEPSYVTYVAAKVSDVTGRSVEQVCEITTRNFLDAMGQQN
jgi:TatD DNase family protein